MILYSHLADGVVRFERKGRDKKQVSIVPVEQNNPNYARGFKSVRFGALS